jgi:hypothetical protein
METVSGKSFFLLLTIKQGVGGVFKLTVYEVMPFLCIKNAGDAPDTQHL